MNKFQNKIFAGKALAHFCVVIATIFISTGAIAKEYNILDFGVVGDSMTINTKGIQKAIDTCSETKGKIVFPAGNYVTGTIFLKSNVHMELQEGAVIYASVNYEDYPVIKYDIPTAAGRFADHVLVYASGKKNFSITGKGQINGRGDHPKFNLMRESKEHMHRPFMIQFVNCKNVRMEGLELNSPSLWCQHYLACTDLYLIGLNVNAHAAPNNDGMDIDDCRNVVVSDCIIYCEDDGICFKSNTPYGSENITVTNCVVRTNCNAIKFGTDGHTSFKNVNISNIVINEPIEAKETFFGTKHGICGIAIEAVDGTELENLNFSNISIKNTDTPFYIKLGDRLRKSTPDEPDKEVGYCRNITFSNITVSGVSEFASNITGMPRHYVENVIFNNIIYEMKGYTGYNPDDMLDIPEKSNNYPSPEIYGVFPAYGFYVRHAKNIVFKNMQIFTDGKDSRHAFVFDNVEGFRVSEVDFHSKGNPSVIRVVNSSDAAISLNNLHQNTGALIEVEGKKSKNIMVVENNCRKAEKTVEVSAEVNSKEVYSKNNWEE